VRKERLVLTQRSLASLIEASLGKSPLDLVIKGGRLLDVYRGLWTDGDIGIAGNRIVSFGAKDLAGKEVVDAEGKWVVPGFFDSHFHAGGCHLSPTNLARALLARGTTTTVCDFQEHYVVGGTEAARFALDEAKAAGLRVYYLVPIHMFVVDHLGVSGRGMRVEDLMEMLEWPETVAINEPPPGPVLGKHREALEVIVHALNSGKIYTGHAPELSGRRLQAYAATGASSDHESTKPEDAWMKLAYGIKIIMREGSAAPDLEALVELVPEHEASSRHMMFGTDEVDPIDLASQGHMDYKIRLALSKGVDPIVAFQMSSLNAAEYYRVDHEVGSLAPGRYADMVILSDLQEVKIANVISNGRVVKPVAEADIQPAYPPSILGGVRLQMGLSARDFRIGADLASGRKKVKAIGLVDGSLVSKDYVATLPVAGNDIRSDPEQDILKIAVIDRFSGKSEIGRGFVKGLGIRDGAVATTYAHPFYNLLVVGDDEASMALAANRVADLGGGMVAVRSARVLREWPLPLVGVFSEESLEEVVRNFQGMNSALRELGCTFQSPILALSFSALVTIPDLGLTSKGLFDVNRGEFVPVLSDE
jgi:adenine deaminase